MIDLSTGENRASLDVYSRTGLQWLIKRVDTPSDQGTFAKISPPHLRQHIGLYINLFERLSINGPKSELGGLFSVFYNANEDKWGLDSTCPTCSCPVQ